MVEGLFRRFRHQGMSEDDAFLNSVECITGMSGAQTRSESGVWNCVEGLLRRFWHQGMSEDNASLNSMECITGGTCLCLGAESRV